jgi:hypothetical protein
LRRRTAEWSVLAANSEAAPRPRAVAAPLRRGPKIEN